MVVLLKALSIGAQETIGLKSDWMLQVEPLILMGTSQLLTVPYAMYAEKVGTLGIFETDPIIYFITFSYYNSHQYRQLEYGVWMG